MPKILIADDHNIVRQGIIKTISDNIPNTKFGEASTTADALKLFRKEDWDLLIVDINMPGRSGIEVLKDAKKTKSHVPVIVLSMYPEDQFALRVLKDGAAAYINKDIGAKELVSVIKKSLKGEQYITPTVAKLLANQLQNDSNQPLHRNLSDREYEVFRKIASGKSVSVVGKELSLSVKTISVYRTNILKKMGLKNNSEITHYAFKNKLVE